MKARRNLSDEQIDPALAAIVEGLAVDTARRDHKREMNGETQTDRVDGNGLKSLAIKRAAAG